MSPRRIGTVLSEMRTKREMTQEELSKKAKVTRSYIALLESGEKKNPSLAILKRLAKALAVPIGELLQ
jgi:transcriptional regulator with XRE-family HTH domain